MKIHLNSEPLEVPASLTLAGLIAEHFQHPSMHLVELNGEHIRRSDYSRPLNENDRIETLQVAAGG